MFIRTKMPVPDHAMNCSYPKYFILSWVENSAPHGSMLTTLKNYDVKEVYVVCFYAWTVYVCKCGRKCSVILCIVFLLFYFLFHCSVVILHVAFSGFLFAGTRLS